MLVENTHNGERGMAKQPDATEMVAEARPEGFVSDWRKVKQPTFGESLLADIDPTNSYLLPDQRAAIMRIEDVEALKAMLYADLGDPINVDIATASKIFGTLLNRKSEIPNILMAWHFLTIIECRNCIEDHTILMNDKTLPGAERVKAGKLRLEANRSLNRMIMNAQRLAKTVGSLTIYRGRADVDKKPKNVAPEFGG